MADENQAVSSESIAEALKGIGVPDEHIQATIDAYTNVASGNGAEQASPGQPQGDIDAPVTKKELEAMFNSHMETVTAASTKKAQSFLDSSLRRLSEDVNKRIGNLEQSHFQSQLGSMTPEQQIQKRLELLEQRKQQAPQSQTIFTAEQLLSHVKAFEIDPNDKRLDWGTDAADFHTGFGRLNASIAKIKSEDHAKAVKAAQQVIEAETKKKLGEGRVPGKQGSPNPQRDAIVEAWIKDPDDPKASKAYMELRASEGQPLR